MLTPIKSEDGNLRILRGDSYTINPEIIQDIAYRAFGEICDLATGGPRYAVAFLFLISCS